VLRNAFALPRAEGFVCPAGCTYSAGCAGALDRCRLAPDGTDLFGKARPSLIRSGRRHSQIMIRNLRWYIVGLLTLVTVINYLDRNALSVAQVALEDELGITTADYGRIVSYFLIAYGIFHPLGPARSIAWARGSGCRSRSSGGRWPAWARVRGGVRSFGAARFLLGVGEAGNFPPRSRRGRVVSAKERGWPRAS